ncbi:hypothetical protein F511_16513 [Dorcoceras hygrometricum]|uniref:Uncharacterized protein n=1 Tax=Dorcoceras hygrometricum TaxID=472368 RepID=A0A2Z7CSP5_9LAMI|nr:hypothetical protein F511_16513 [Dorcoceras hygrometricum]
MAAGATPDYGATDCAMACWPSAGQHATIRAASARRSGRPIAQQAAVDPPIRSTTGINLPPSICTIRLDGFYHGRNLLSTTIGASPITGRRRVVARTAARGREGGEVEGRPRLRSWRLGTCVTLNGSGIQLAVGPQPLRLRNHNFGFAHRIMVKSLATSSHDPLGITDSAFKNQLVVVSVQYGPFNSYIPIRSTTIGIQLAVGPQPLRLRNHNFGFAHRIMVKSLATSSHDPLGITDSAFKNQLVVVSVQYGPFNSYIPIRSTTIGKSRVARDSIAMHTSWRSNSDITSVTSIGYPRMKASGESSTTKYRLLHASGPHPISPPNDPNMGIARSDHG